MYIVEESLNSDWYDGGSPVRAFTESVDAIAWAYKRAAYKCVKVWDVPLDAEGQPDLVVEYVKGE